MNKRLPPFLVVLLAFLVLPASSFGASKDEKATRAYIFASYSLIQAARASIPTAEASVATLNKQIGEECSHVALESPQNHESEKLADEVAGALWSIVYHLDAPAISKFTAVVKPLRWSNHKLTRIADNYANSLSELAALTMPNLCTDVRAWTVSGFQTVPTSTIVFDKQADAIGAATIPPKLLTPYERGSDKQVAVRTSHMELSLEHAESSIGFDDWSSLLETLGLNQ
jgi:hypothetical protein